MSNGPTEDQGVIVYGAAVIACWTFWAGVAIVVVSLLSSCHRLTPEEKAMMFGAMVARGPIAAAPSRVSEVQGKQFLYPSVSRDAYGPTYSPR